MKQNKKTIIVTGTPGVGKTTIAKKLTEKLNANYVGITELVKQQNLVESTDEKRDTLIADTKKLVQQLTQILAETEDTTIIDGHYAVDVIPKTDVNTVFVLRRDPRQLKKTLEKRGYTEKKLWENIAAELLDTCLIDAITTINPSKVCEIDVTDKTLETITKEMTLVLDKKKDCTYGTVDWLGILETQGKLEKYLQKIGSAEQT